MAKENLFQIQAELQDIILQLEEGEATDELIAKLGITEDNLKEKISSYLTVIKRYQADVNECKQEKDRVSQIQKVRNNTCERLKKMVLDAVLQFGTTGKSGNKVIEGSTYKVYTTSRDTVVVDTLYVADIIRHFVSIVTEYLSSTEVQEGLDLDYLARLISKYMTAEKQANELLPLEEKEKEINLTRDDLTAIETEITINLRLSDLANPSNFNLATWIGQNPHRVSVSQKINLNTLKEQYKLNADLTICKPETNVSLIIK